MSEYPEHDKLLAVKDQTQVIGEFLEWVSDKYGGQLMAWTDVSEMFSEYAWVVLPKSTLDLLAEWAGIDQRELEREKCAMLQKLRELNEEGDDAGPDAADAGSDARGGNEGGSEGGEGAESGVEAREGDRS